MILEIMFFEGLTSPPIKKLHVLIAEGLGKAEKPASGRPNHHGLIN